MQLLFCYLYCPSADNKAIDLYFVHTNLQPAIKMKSRQIHFFRSKFSSSGSSFQSSSSENGIVSPTTEPTMTSFKLTLPALNPTPNTRRHSFQSLRPPNGPFPYLRKRSSLTATNQPVIKVVVPKTPQEIFEEKMSYLDAKLAKLQVNLNAAEKEKKYAVKPEKVQSVGKNVTSAKLTFNLANFREKFNLPPRSNCHDMILTTSRGQQLNVSSKFPERNDRWR